jgi:hypothetical protein
VKIGRGTPRKVPLLIIKRGIYIYMDDEITKFIHYWNSRGVKLPSPMNYPETFKYYVKLWKYSTKSKGNE